MNILNFSKEKQKRTSDQRALSESLMRERRLYKMLLDDIARCDNPHERRAYAKMLGRLCHDHGYRSGGGHV